MSERIEYLINRVLEGASAEAEIEKPSILMVSYKKDVENLYKTLKDLGLRPVYRYANTSARTPFIFKTDDTEGTLALAFKIATDLGIKCQLV